MTPPIAVQSSENYSPVKAPAPKNHIPSLDGIRALAFLIVFSAHAGTPLMPGGFGVTIFFFLSGYLITTLLRIEYEKTGKIHLPHFYLRRIYRIFPPMYITLGFCILLTFAGFFENNMSLSGVLSQIFHMTNFFRIYSDEMYMVPNTGVFWSLAIEEHFYLIFPAALILMLKGCSYKKIAIVLFVTCIAVLLWRCVLVFHFDVERLRTYAGSDTRADSLLYGCILGLWSNPWVDKTSVLECRKNLLTQLSVLFACIAILLFCFVLRNYNFRETLRYSLQGLALLPVFYYAIKYSNWIIFSWMEFKYLRWIGTLSYTLYLCHQTFLDLVPAFFPVSDDPGIIRGVLALLLSVLFSTLVFFAVEKPCARLRKKLHDEYKS